MQLIHVKGVERGGPRFGATSELIMPTAVCACLVALLLWCALSVLCACWGYHVLIDSTGVVCGGGGIWGPRGRSTEESNNTSTQRVHTGTWYFDSYLVLLLYVRTKA